MPEVAPMMMIFLCERREVFKRLFTYRERFKSNLE